MSDADLKRIIRSVEDLPTLPRTVLKITELVNDPKSSAKDLALIITDDQVLTARLLRIVNSSFYGFPRRISTVTEAIVLLGFDSIRHLLLTTSVFDLFRLRGGKGGAELEKFWDHSLACAVGAKTLGRHLHHDRLEELFVAGLLHDIGKIVVMMTVPAKFEQVDHSVRERHMRLLAAEDAVLGFTHAEAGRVLAEHWNLPLKLVHAIAFHHQPSAAGAYAADTAVVHLADIFARALDLGCGTDDGVPPLDRRAWKGLGIKPAAFDALMASMIEEFEAIHSFLI
jgi:HD-like signal output (HDOD) protein